MKTLGEKVRDRRAELGLTQQQLADEVGIALKTLTNIEVRGAMPRSTTLHRLCVALGVSDAYLTNDKIDDPAYGLEEASYVDGIRQKYGRKTARDMEDVLETSRAFFAGGDIPKEEKDKFFMAFAAAYGLCKEDARESFTPKKYRK